eukprot:2656244-Amphidinium_carterae.2
MIIRSAITGTAAFSNPTPLPLQIRLQDAIPETCFAFSHPDKIDRGAVLILAAAAFVLHGASSIATEFVYPTVDRSCVVHGLHCGANTSRATNVWHILLIAVGLCLFLV